MKPEQFKPPDRSRLIDAAEATAAATAVQWPVYVSVLTSQARDVIQQWDVERVARLVEQHGPELVILTSAVEIDLIQFHEIWPVLRACRQAVGVAEVQYISVGCLGLYASILRFSASIASKALVIFLECPVHLVQHCLDEIGLGAGGDGLIGQEGCSAVLLSSAPAQDSLRVDSCEIVTMKPPFRLVSLKAFIERVVTRLTALVEPGSRRIVSFVTHSAYARKIMRLVQQVGRESLGDEVWLPSIEDDERHYMTRKCLIELEHYRERLEDGPLVLTCLGVAGRMGILRLSSPSSPVDEGAVRRPLNRRVLRGTVRPEVVSDEERRQMGTKEGLVNLRDLTWEPLPLCVDERYFGIDDSYFEWQLDLDGSPVLLHSAQQQEENV